jgi:hypothetical protein
MSATHILNGLEPNETKEATKTPSQENSSNSKLHQVLLAHMIKNSKQIEGKTEKE